MPLWPYWSFIWELHETSYRRINGTLWIRTNETSWWRTTETSLGVSFETCLRRRGDVLMGHRHKVPLRRHYNILIRRRGDVPLRRLGDVPLIRHWVFHLRRTCDAAGTYRETSLWRSHDVLLPGGSFSFFKIRFTIFWSTQFVSRFRINSEVFSPYSYSCQSYLCFIKYCWHNWYNWSNWLL